MEEAAGSEVSFCLQSILPPQECFPPSPRPRRAARGCRAPRGPAGFPPQGGERCGRARLLSVWLRRGDPWATGCGLLAGRGQGAVPGSALRAVLFN